MPHHGRFVSAVPRVAGTRFVQVREDLLKIVESKAVCASLLDQLIYFADLSDWQPFKKSFPDLEEAIMWMRCQKTIREHVLPKLEELGFIGYQKDQGQETVITVNLEAINEALSKAYPSQPQLRKNFQSTPEKLPEYPGKTSRVDAAPSLVGVKDPKDPKDLKDNSTRVPAREAAVAEIQNVNGNGAEIVSYLHDQAIKHGVRVRFTGKQKDWLRENESVEIREAAISVMATRRGRRTNVTEAIMAAVGYSKLRGHDLHWEKGPTGRQIPNRQRTRASTPKGNHGFIKFETELLKKGEISQEEFDELRAED